jgi:hypothetical protein
VEYLDGREELFDLRSDPLETENIAHLHPDLTARFYAIAARERTEI